MAKRSPVRKIPKPKVRHGKSKQPQPVTFNFNHFAVTRLAFQENAKPSVAEGEPVPYPYAVQMQFSVNVILADVRSAEVHLSVHVVPDQRARPYDVQVTVAGQFSTPNGTNEQLGEFCRSVAPMMLFPYARQWVHTLTTDAKHGTVRLNPVDLNAVLSGDGWTEDRPPKPSA